MLTESKNKNHCLMYTDKWREREKMIKKHINDIKLSFHVE